MNVLDEVIIVYSNFMLIYLRQILSRNKINNCIVILSLVMGYIFLTI